MKAIRLISTLSLAALALAALAVPPAAQAQSAPVTCTAATVQGVHAVTINGRALSGALAYTGTYQAVGTANFDGVSKVTLTLTANTNLAQGTAQTLVGTYSLASNCVGTVSITMGDTASYTLIAFNTGKNFTLTGQDGTYVLTGSGSATPMNCITSSLSGTYAFSGNGSVFSGANITGVNNISGLLTFDGRGGVTGNWSVATSAGNTSDTATGQYTVSAACGAVATLQDKAGTPFSMSFIVSATNDANFSAGMSNTQSAFSVTGHATFNDPGLTIVNGGSYAAGGTPPGSDFVLFGTNLATSSAQANVVPLPKSLLTTSVTVNGESVPLYFVNAGQINAQMPLDVQRGLAAVTVTSGTTMSNTAAVMVPATAAPGIFFYGSDRGVVQNPNFSLNSPTAPAHVGDVLVAYFTGGGPVTASGPLGTGSASPMGLSPVTAKASVTVAGQPATVNYIGLAPTLVGVYQVNFVVPQVAVGDRTVVISIGGVNSIGELITVD